MLRSQPIHLFLGAALAQAALLTSTSTRSPAALSRLIRASISNNAILPRMRSENALLRRLEALSRFGPRPTLLLDVLFQADHQRGPDFLSGVSSIASQTLANS